MSTCQGRTLTGFKCSRRVSQGDTYCYQHQDPEYQDQQDQQHYDYHIFTDQAKKNIMNAYADVATSSARCTSQPQKN
jgi:hypothetical protein